MGKGRRKRREKGEREERREKEERERKGRKGRIGEEGKKERIGVGEGNGRPGLLQARPFAAWLCRPLAGPAGGTDRTRSRLIWQITSLYLYFLQTQTIQTSGGSRSFRSFRRYGSSDRSTSYSASILIKWGKFSQEMSFGGWERTRAALKSTGCQDGGERKTRSAGRACRRLKARRRAAQSRAEQSLSSQFWSASQEINQYVWDGVVSEK